MNSDCLLNQRSMKVNAFSDGMFKKSILKNKYFIDKDAEKPVSLYTKMFVQQ